MNPVYLSRTLRALTLMSLASAAPIAHAEAVVPKVLLASKPATTGATDVATSGFDKKEAPPADAEKNNTSLQVTAGALSSSGNTKTLALTGSSRFKARREDNQLS